MILLILILCTIISLIIFETRKWLINQSFKEFSNPNEIPLFGIAHRIIGKTNENVVIAINNLFDETYWKPFRAWFGPFVFVGVSDPKSVEIILESMERSSKLQNIDIWQKHLKSVFGKQKFKTYFPLIDEKIQFFIENVKLTKIIRLNIKKEIYKCAVDLVGTTLFGIDLKTQTIVGNLLYFSSKNLNQFTIERFSYFWLNINSICNLTNIGINNQLATDLLASMFNSMCVDKFIELKRNFKNFNNNFDTKDLNFLEKCLWMKNVNILTEQEILENLQIIYHTTIDSITNGIYLVLLMLAIHPNYQEKLYREISSKNFDQIKDENQLKKYNFLDCVLKETFRLFPLKPFILQKTTENILLENNCKIPLNTNVLINLNSLHKNPNIWKVNPRQFDPMRFSIDNNQLGLHPFSYIPFGIETCNVICEEYVMITMKIILIHLLNRYEFSTDLQLEEIQMQLRTFIEINDRNPFRIKQRNY